MKELHDAGACQTSFRPDNVIVIGSPFPAPRPPPAVEVNGNACEGVGRVERSVDESGAVDDGAAKPEADSRHEDLHEALDADHVDSSARTLKQTRATNDDPACAEADETSATPPHELDQNVDGPQCARLVDSARSDPREPGEPCEAETELPHGLDEDVRPLEPLERAPARCSRETESRPVDGKLQHGNECEEVGGGDGEAGGTDEQGGAGKDQSGGEDVEKKGAVNGTGDGHQGATKAHAREGAQKRSAKKGGQAQTIPQGHPSRQMRSQTTTKRKTAWASSLSRSSTLAASASASPPRAANASATSASTMTEPRSATCPDASIATQRRSQTRNATPSVDFDTKPSSTVDLFSHPILPMLYTTHTAVDGACSRCGRIAMALRSDPRSVVFSVAVLVVALGIPRVGSHSDEGPLDDTGGVRTTAHGPAKDLGGPAQLLRAPDALARGPASAE